MHKVHHQDEFDSLGAPTDSKRYANACRKVLRGRYQNLASNWSHVVKYLDLAEKHEIWTHYGFDSIEELLAADELPDEKTLRKECRVAAERARDDGKALSLGVNQHQGCNDVTPSKTRGNDATYLARRLLRDAPVIFEALERGEYKSVRQAAIAAGIVKVPTNEEKARTALARLTPSQLEDVLSSAMMTDYEIRYIVATLKAAREAATTMDGGQRIVQLVNDVLEKIEK